MSDLSEAITTTNSIESALADFFLVSGFDFLELVCIERDGNIPECAFGKIVNGFGIDVNSVVAHFKMQMCTERATRVAANTDYIASLELVADLDLPAFEVGVKCCKSIAVIENHVTTVTLAASLVADLDDLACKSGDNRAVFAVAEAKVNSAMHAVLARTVMTCDAAA